MVEGENREITTEKAADSLVDCAIYARDNNLLDTDGWKQFRFISKRQSKMFHIYKQAKIRAMHTAQKYKYGFELARNYNMWSKRTRI